MMIFVHLGQANTYTVVTSYPQGQIPLLQNFPQPHVVTFTSTDPILVLPNPRYLQLHAAVCRVAHLSGTAEYLWQFDRDLEEKGVLAHDGSSAALLASELHQALHKISIGPWESDSAFRLDSGSHRSHQSQLDPL